MFQNFLISLLKFIKLNVQAFFVAVIIIIAGLIYLISQPSINFLNSLPNRFTAFQEDNPITNGTLSLQNVTNNSFFSSNTDSSESEKIATSGATTSVSNVEQVNQANRPGLTSDKYIVSEGDSLWSIAESKLGSGYKFVELAQANNLNPSHPLYVGTELDILVTQTPISGEVNEQLPAPQELISDNDNQVEQIITVKAGDSLWSIAQEKLGNGNLWIQVYQNNKSVIGQNPNLIYPNQQLKVSRSSVK